jgi:prepilin-type N-terminal cleavage/methylation domain-containing protein
MKPTVTQARKKRAFTIIELLTVMSIIVILIGLMVPALNKVRRYARDVQQKAQFNAINAAVELFNNEFDGYPPSTAKDSMGMDYCGAMKLCEALMGQDLLGFHTNSVFRRDGLDAAGRLALYPPNIDAMTPALRENNLRARKGPFLQAENANAFQMQDIYGTNIGPFLGTTFVLCDVYSRQMQSGKKTGMPVLYYRADTANSYHDPNFASAMLPADSRGNIYNYWDNQELIKLGKAWQASGASSGISNNHKMVDPMRFYRNTRIDQITTTQRPQRADTFILISAGWDGEYGTADDICNFEWRYRE